MAAGHTTGDPDAGPLVHDAAGRVLAATGPLGLDSLGYTPDGTLRAVRRGGITWRSRLDAAGHRVVVQGDTGLARVWVRVGATVLAELRAADGAAPSAWDVYLAPAGRAAAVGRHPHSGARRLYHRDALGSVRVETSGATTVAGRDYDPWGVELPGRTLGAAGAGGGPGFTGHPRDPASGLDLAWARALSPGLGRWTAPDPLRADFPGWTPYHYAENDPLGRTDPTGLCPIPPTNCADVALFGWDLVDFVRRPSMQTATGVLLGAGGLVPGIPNLNPGLRAGRSASNALSLITYVPATGRKANQLLQRGWSRNSINSVVNQPFATRRAINRATGNPATAYFRADGHYIVRDDVTAELVQISDTRLRVGFGRGEWKPDAGIRNPVLPPR